MNEKFFVGLDIATNMGIAIYKYGDSHVFVTEINEKDNCKQLTKLYQLFNKIGINKDNSEVYYEKFVYLNGFASAIRSLLLRYGYIFYSLQFVGYVNIEINISSARKFIKSEKGKKKKELVLEYYQQFSKIKLTNNETDALLLINEHLPKIFTIIKE